MDNSTDTVGCWRHRGRRTWAEEQEDEIDRLGLQKAQAEDEDRWGDAARLSEQIDIRRRNLDRA